MASRYSEARRPKPSENCSPASPKARADSTGAAGTRAPAITITSPAKGSNTVTQTSTIPTVTIDATAEGTNSP